MGNEQKDKEEAPDSKGLQDSSISPSPVLDNDQKEEKQSPPVLDDGDQGEKRESPHSKGSQDSISTSAIVEVVYFPEEFDDDFEFVDHDDREYSPKDCDFDCSDNDKILEEIFLSMQSPSSGPRTSNFHRRSEAVGDTAAPKFPHLRKHKGIPASPSKPHDSKQKGVCISHEMDPLDRLFGRRTWLRPRPHERGESSWSVCVICGEHQPPTQRMKRLYQCGHRFCEDCMRAYVATLVEKNDQMAKCPHQDCKERLTWEQCRSYLPREVADRWVDAVVEATTLGNTRYIQCPFPDCSAVFLDDRKGFLIRDCPKCLKIFCV